MPVQQIILQAMVAMALSDGHSHAREVAVICRIHKDVTGSAITADDVRSTIADQTHTPISIRDLVRPVKADLDDAAKEQLIKAVYRVLLADGAVAAGERKILCDTATALGMEEIHYQAVLEGIAEL